MSPKDNTKEVWDRHYLKEKSKLKYPDENLVRILGSIPKKGKALDFGAGSGRHCLLLKDFGFDVCAADYSENSVFQIRALGEDFRTYHATSVPYDFVDEEFDLIVCWGVLHYNTIQESEKIISEFQRILKKGGVLAGTIRSTNDTHLNVNSQEIRLNDLIGGQVFLYSLEDLKKLLKGFQFSEFGYSERTPMGKLEERICHWIFKTVK